MKTGLRTSTRWHERLGVQLGFLLSLALLPIGGLAGFQTYRTMIQASEIAKTALLGRTAEAAAGERSLIQTALGAGDALAPTILDSSSDSATCSQMLAEFVQSSPVFVFVGFIDTQGRLVCASQDQGRDLSGTPGFAKLKTSARTNAFVTHSDRGAITGRPVMIVTQPLRRDGALAGYLSISIPSRDLQSFGNFDVGGVPFNILTYNALGEVLTVAGTGGEAISRDTAEELFPQGVEFRELTAGYEGTFRGVSKSGERRVFSVVPIVPGLVFAMGSFRPGGDVGLSALRGLSALMFPVLMWVASILVSYVAVDRLVILHVRELRSQMRRFALGDRTRPPEVLASAPAEIQDVSQTFHNLARILIRDEQQLEASVREKTVLLKEIHHRVKNNLQLIASIVNMQIRQVQEPVARRVLKSVQERVMSLAAVHRRLYQADNLTAVRADELLGEVIAQMIALSATGSENPAIDADIEPVLLTPEAAVPVALLTTEAVTNAIKYAQPDAPGKRAEIHVSLKRQDDGVLLMIENSLDPATGAHTDTPTGLGAQLIAAFAAQLGSKIDQEISPQRFVLQVHLPDSQTSQSETAPAA